MAYFEHRESRLFLGQGMTVDVSREIFDAHPELRDGTVPIVPSVRSLASKVPNQNGLYQGGVLRFSKKRRGPLKCWQSLRSKW